MNEDRGFRAWFCHEDGEHYSMLLKGVSIEQAVRSCREECLTHHVAFVRLEAWVRRASSPRVRLGNHVDEDRWEGDTTG